MADNAARSVETVAFNVGGRRFETSRALLDRQPVESTLRRLVAEHDDADGAIFIDRDGDTFSHILNYLRHDGDIVLPLNVPWEMFLRDLEYYGIVNDDAVGRISSPGQEVGEAHLEEADHAIAELQSQLNALKAIEITGPGRGTVYARGRLQANGHVSNLGRKGEYWTEWLQKAEPLPLDQLTALEIWIGGTLRGGFVDTFDMASWIKIGKNTPLVFLCSRPGNVTLAVNFGWTADELANELEDLTEFAEARDKPLMRFLCEELAVEDPTRTCEILSISVPISRNLLLDPNGSGTDVPQEIFVGQG